MVKDLAKSHFKGKKTKTSRLVPKYPESAERELRRIANAVSKMVRDELKKVLPDIMEQYGITVQLRLDSSEQVRMDGYNDLIKALNDAAEIVKRNIETKMKSYNVRRLVENAAKSAKKLSISEWKRICQGVVGINILEDYYNGEFFKTVIDQWVETNIQQIKNIPDYMFNNVKQTVLDAFYEGKTNRALQKEIQEKYDVDKHQAELIARDQLATLNSQLARQQMEDAGCTKYKWSSSKDQRVRDCHQALDGRIFSFDNPPEMWYKTKSRGIVFTGRRCNPGEDFMCRCVAIPVFDFDNLSLPTKG